MEPPGRRRLPTATDVLVIAEDQGITVVQLARVGSIANGFWSNISNWIGGDVPDSTQDVYIAHGGSVTLDVDGQAKNLKILSGANSVAVQNHSLYVLGTEANGAVTNSTLNFDGAALSVGSGGTIAANYIIGNPGALTTAAGSLVRFNAFTPGSSTPTSASFNGSVALGFDNDPSGLVSPMTTDFLPSWANWTIAENLIIGDENFANLVVDNGTWTVNGNVTLGKVIDTFLNGGWTGGVALQNNGVMTIGGNLDIPIGTVTVEDTATLNVAGNITIGKQSQVAYRDNRAAARRPYSVAGGQTVFVDGMPIYISGGTLSFEDTANATDAIVTVEGGAGAAAAGGLVVFSDNASAGDVVPPITETVAEFRTKGGRFGAVSSGNGGQVVFQGNSTALNAMFVNEGTAESSGGTGGRTIFVHNSTAAQASIHNHGPAYINGDAGATHFFENSTAGSATITNHADGTTTTGAFNTRGRTVFYDSSDAGNATIENEGAPYNPGGSTPPGLTEFRSNSSAAFSNIHNRAVVTTSGLAPALPGAPCSTTRLRPPMPRSTPTRAQRPWTRRIP